MLYLKQPLGYVFCAVAAIGVAEIAICGRYIYSFG